MQGQAAAIGGATALEFRDAHLRTDKQFDPGRGSGLADLQRVERCAALHHDRDTLGTRQPTEGLAAATAAAQEAVLANRNLLEAGDRRQVECADIAFEHQLDRLASMSGDQPGKFAGDRLHLVSGDEAAGHSARVHRLHRDVLLSGAAGQALLLDRDQQVRVEIGKVKRIDLIRNRDRVAKIACGARFRSAQKRRVGRRRVPEPAGCIDDTGAVLEAPVTAERRAAGRVGRCCDIKPGEVGQILYKTDTRLSLGHVAAIEQQVTAGRYGLAPVLQAAGHGVKPRAVECGAAQADRATLAMAEDMHRSQVLERRQHLRYLLDTVPCVVQHDDQGVRRGLRHLRQARAGWHRCCLRLLRRCRRQRRQTLQQRLVVLYAGVDDHDLPRRRLRRHKGGERPLGGLGRVHTGM